MDDQVAPLPQQPYAIAPPTPGKAIAALVCGILGITLCGCFPLGIVAWVLGKQAESEIRRSGGALQGDGLAKAGWITGIIGTVGGVLYAGAIAVFMVISLIADHSGY